MHRGSEQGREEGDNARKEKGPGRSQIGMEKGGIEAEWQRGREGERERYREGGEM